MTLDGFTNTMLEKFINQLYNKDNKKWVDNKLLSPIAAYIEQYLKPYFLTLLICLMSIILLLVYNIRLMFKILNNV